LHLAIGRFPPCAPVVGLKKWAKNRFFLTLEKLDDTENLDTKVHVGFGYIQRKIFYFLRKRRGLLRGGLELSAGCGFCGCFAYKFTRTAIHTLRQWYSIGIWYPRLISCFSLCRQVSRFHTAKCTRIVHPRLTNTRIGSRWYTCYKRSQRRIPEGLETSPLPATGWFLPPNGRAHRQRRLNAGR